MKKRLVLLSVLAIATAAQALTLKEKKQLLAWQEYLKSPDESYVKSVQDKCGYDIPVTLDEKLVTPFMEANAHAASFCDHTRSTIASMCEDPTSKTAIKAKIKKVECKLGKKDEATLKLAGSTLVFTFGPEASNLDDKIKTFLENQL